MRKSVAYLCIICICFLKIVQLTSLPYRPLSKEEQNRVALQCINEVNIERAIIEKIVKTQILPKENKKYKSYLECSYKKQGYLSSDGKKILYDNLFQFLQRFYDMEKLKTLEHCKLIKDDDAGELCFQNLKCILEGLRKIELYEEIESNDIE